MIRLYSTQFIIHALIFVMVYFLLLTIAECVHALTAYWCGDSTPKDLGRLTLDPFQHIDLLGTLSLCLLGFGWSKSMPLNSNNIRHPYRSFKLATVFLAPIGVYLFSAVIALVTLLKIFGKRVQKFSLDISLISKECPDLSSLAIVFSMILLAIVHIAIMLIAVRIMYGVVDFLISKFLNHSTIDALFVSFVSLFIMIKCISPLMHGIGCIVGSIVYLII